MGSETLAHILSLLNKNFIIPDKNITIHFPFDVETFCKENDLKLKLLREGKLNEK